VSEQAAELRFEVAPTRRDHFGARLIRRPSGIAGLAIVALLAIISFAAALGFLPHPPLQDHPDARLVGPSSEYWFGTDQFGRDIASRVMAGIAATLRTSIFAVGLAASVGTVAGIAGGYLGGWVDAIVSRVADVFFAFPAILLALALASSLGPGWINTGIAIGVVYLPIFVRVARGPVLALREADFVRAGRGLGFSASRLLFRHLLPNIAAVLVIQIALALSWSILTEASLSFLGLGTQPPDPSLGLMVSDARALAATAWWTLAGPSLGIMVTVVGFTLLGDGLRAVLDPKEGEEA
jgi:peptide/nickel transport system permease protein